MPVPEWATFPALVLPAFIAAAFLLAMVSWRVRPPALSFALVLLLTCAAGGILLFRRHMPAAPQEAAGADACIEVDMLVSRGNTVDLFLNDWQHPPERVPVVPGQRHVYRFSKVPPNISLIRLDPTDVASARFVIYSVAVKSGSQVLRQFGPADLKGWKQNQVSPPREEGGGLAMNDTGDDPILWNQVSLALPVSKPAEPP